MTIHIIDIFYLLGLCIIAYQIRVIIKPNNIKETDLQDIALNVSVHIKKNRLGFVYLFFKTTWVIIGLFTEQKLFFWMIFVTMWLLPNLAYFTKGFDFFKKNRKFSLIIQTLLILCMLFFHFKPILFNQ